MNRQFNFSFNDYRTKCKKKQRNTKNIPFVTALECEKPIPSTVLIRDYVEVIY